MALGDTTTFTAPQRHHTSEPCPVRPLSLCWAELLIRVMKDGDSYYDDEEDMPGSGSQGSDSEQPVSTTIASESF